MSEFTIEIETKIVDGWISNSIEYALVEVKVGNNEPELILFNSIEED